jgi:hypothetical protein
MLLLTSAKIAQQLNKDDHRFKLYKFLLKDKMNNNKNRKDITIIRLFYCLIDFLFLVLTQTAFLLKLRVLFLYVESFLD